MRLEEEDCLDQHFDLQLKVDSCLQRKGRRIKRVTETFTLHRNKEEDCTAGKGSAPAQVLLPSDGAQVFWPKLDRHDLVWATIGPTDRSKWDSMALLKNRGYPVWPLRNVTPVFQKLRNSCFFKSLPVTTKMAPLLFG